MNPGLSYVRLTTSYIRYRAENYVIPTHHMTHSKCRPPPGQWFWIGLDLFNDDTRPSGHISRPTQVNVSESLSFSKQLLKSNNIVQSGG